MIHVAGLCVCCLISAHEPSSQRLKEQTMIKFMQLEDKYVA